MLDANLKQECERCRWEEWDAATTRAMQQRALAGQARCGSPEAGYASDLEEEDRYKTSCSWATCPHAHATHIAMVWLPGTKLPLLVAHDGQLQHAKSFGAKRAWQNAAVLLPTG